MSGPSPAAKRYVPTQTNKEGTGNDVMAELQALLKGRRASTDRVLGSPRAQRKAAAGKSNSVSEKRMNSAEKVSSDLREPERASSQGPNSNTKWHVPPPSSAKKPIQPPLKASPIPIPGAGTSLVPDPGLQYSDDLAESPPSQSRAAAFTSSVGAVVSMSVTNVNQSSSSNSSGGRAALTQSLPKSNLNRIGPPPNAPPPRLVQQGNSATTSATARAGSPGTTSSPGQMSSGGARKVSGGSPFPPKMTQKTSNITFNEPVKVTKKGAGKKAPLVTSKSSASVGIKRLLFKKKGNKKDGTSEPAVAVSANLKKTKSEQKFNLRPLSPEGDQTSGSDSETANTPKAPVSCSVPTSTSTPSFAYQNIFDDEAFMSRNQHKFEDAQIDKKPMPLPRKNSLSGTAVKSIGFKMGGRSQDIATTVLQEEEVPSNQDSGTDSPTPDRQKGRGKRDSDSQLWYIGSPPPTSSLLAAVMSAEKRSRPGSPSSVRTPPPAASSPTGVLSPTSKGKDPRSVISPEPKKKLRSTEAFLPVTNVGSSINLLSDLSKYPLFQSDPAVSASNNTSAVRSSPANKKQELVKTTSRGLPGSIPIRRRSTPREVRRAVMSDGAQLDLDDNDDDYIPMNPIRVTTSMNFLEVSQEETFPVDPRDSGYYLKILGPNENAPTATAAANDNEMEIMSDECPSSPDSYHEVNLGPIVTAPVRESVMSPEDEYVSISGQRPHSIVHDNSKDTNLNAAGVDEDHPLLLSPSAKVQSEDHKEPDQLNQKPNFLIIEELGGRGLKYSDVTITPIGSEGNPIKRKPSAPKKFSYQLVQLEEGKRSKLEDSGDIKAKQASHSQLPKKHGTGMQRRGSEPAAAVASVGLEGERKISAPAGPVHSVQPRAAAASAGVHRENDKDSLSRLADRPLPKVPERVTEQLQKQEESQEDTDNDNNMEEVDENLYYVTTSSFAGKSDKAEPPPLSVAVPGQVPAGRVVWHEYVEIDEAEIVKMGGAMPPLPGQLLRLMPLLRSDGQGMTTAEPTWRMTTFNNHLSDDIDVCAIDRSDSLESCPYIEPPLIGSPPIVPDRPDNLDDLIKRKAVASGEYSYAAVPSQSFGVKWMRFHSSNPRHISLAPVSSKDENEAFVLAPASEYSDKDGASTSDGKEKADGTSQPKSGKKVSEEGFYPPLLPPKTASLLREQRETPASDRPQSYLIPVLTKKKKRNGGQTNIDKGKSKSTSQLSSSSISRDAATGERMESHKGEATKKKRVPPLKPKPYKDVKIAKHQQTEGNPEGLKVMVVDEGYGVRDPGKAEVRNKSSKSKGLKDAHRSRSSTTRMDLSPSDAIGRRLTREKSPSLGNLLETSTSSDFDSREKWIDKENPTAKPAKTSQKSDKVEKNVTPSGQQSTEKREEESGGHLRKQSMAHRPSRSDAVKRRPKTSRESPGVENDRQDESLAVIRRNRETIVKHLSRALDMDNLDLDFEQGGATTAVSDKKESGSGGKGSQSESSRARGLGEILSELDSLLKNNVCSTEDLLQAIQSRLNIKVNIQGESTETESDRNKPQSKQEETVTQHRDQDVEDSPAPSQDAHNAGKQTSHGHGTKAKEENLSEGDINSPASEEAKKKATRAEGTTPFYVNDEILLNWKGLKMETYSPDYMNTKYIPGDQSDASAPNSQSSDQSSSSNDPTSYEDVQKWIDSTNKMESSKSDSTTKIQVKSKSPTAKKSPKLSTRTDNTPTPQEGASSMKEKSKRKIPLQPPIRMRSQSSIDVSPKLRRKKLSNPPPDASELDSPTHGYQLALMMEDERMFSTGTGAHRRTYTVTAKDTSGTRSSSSNYSPGHSTSSSPRLSSSTGQSSSSAGHQRPISGHRMSTDTTPGSVPSQINASNNVAATTSVSPQPTPDHLSVAMTSQQRSPSVVSLITHPHVDMEQARASQKLRHRYQNLFSSDDDSPPVGLLESANIRDSRSFSAGSRPLQRVNTGERRSTNVDPSVLATAAAVGGGGNVFTNGVGVFTYKGGVLMNAGSGVIIEVPEDAIPRGRKQKLWFEVKQDVINPLHDEGHDSSHALSDSFQFSRGSAEFENYLAGKRERKVQLSPMILIGPSDAVFTRPIKIKMPHCLPYRNNSWHLHMFAKAQTSETGDWNELSNTIGLVDLPPRRVRSKVYEKSFYQMHIDYTQVRNTTILYTTVGSNVLLPNFFFLILIGTHQAAWLL